MSTSTTPEFSDRLTVKVNGEDRELFMSFNLRRAAVACVPGLEYMDRMFVDQTIADKILTTVLQKRDEKGKVAVEETLEEITISPDDADVVLHWAGEHIIDFFMKRLGSSAKLNKTFEPKLLALLPEKHQARLLSEAGSKG